MLRRRRDTAELNQNIFAGELPMWIPASRNIALGFDRVIEIENVSSSSERGVDFRLVPNIKGAFRFFALRSRNNTVGIFGRKEAAFPGRHIASDIIEDIARNL